MSNAEVSSPQTLPNRAIFIADNLDVMRRMDSNSIDLIATDPPFNKISFDDLEKYDFVEIWHEGVQLTYRTETGEDFVYTPVPSNWAEQLTDSWKDKLSPIWELAYENCNKSKKYKEGRKGFLIFMALRMIEMHRILKPEGSIYWHCDYRMNYYLRYLLDAIFGYNNFKNEIVWVYKKTSNAKANKFLKEHETILHYVKNKNKKPVFNRSFSGITPRKQKLIEQGWNTKNQMNNKTGKTEKYLYIYDEKKVDNKGIDKSKYDYVKYVNTTQGNALTDVFRVDFVNPQSKEYIHKYDTQKPIELYKQLIESRTNVGEIVLDPFAGCTCTCVAAHITGRKWIGIDINKKVEKNIEKKMKGYNLVLEKEEKDLNTEYKKKKSGKLFDYSEDEDIEFQKQVSAIQEMQLRLKNPFKENKYPFTIISATYRKNDTDEVRNRRLNKELGVVGLDQIQSDAIVEEARQQQLNKKEQDALKQKWIDKNKEEIQVGKNKYWMIRCAGYTEYTTKEHYPCKKEYIYIEDIEKDHIRPKSRGGKNTVENFQFICNKCNRSKSNN